MADWGDSCRFELVEVPCCDCGEPSGIQGTCADIAYCAACRRKCVDMLGETEAAELFQAMALNPARTPWSNGDEK